MLTEIRKYVDDNDIKGLRYIFVDCLDVDPTFEKYKSDYEYCVNMDGLFEQYRELTPLRFDKDAWNMEYWEQLKLDLMKNFSQKRFEHMREVAKVVYAEKIAKLLREREAKKVADTYEKDFEKKNIHSKTIDNKTEKKKDPEITQKEMLEEKRKVIEAENRRIDENQRREAERRKKLYEKESHKRKQRSKKWWGIVLGIVAVVIIVFLIIVEIQ